MTTLTSSTDYETTIPFTAAPEAVFETLTTTEAFADWWRPATGTAGEGGELTLTMSKTMTLVVRVDVARRPSLVTWTVLSCSAPMEDWNGTTIHFAIEPAAGGGSHLAFRHAGLAQLDCFDQCRAGWERHLPALATLLAS